MQGLNFKGLNFLAWYSMSIKSLSTTIKFKFPNHQTRKFTFKDQKLLIALWDLFLQGLFLHCADARGHKRLLLTTFSCSKRCYWITCISGPSERMVSCANSGMFSLTSRANSSRPYTWCKKNPTVFCLEKTTEFTIRLFPHRQVVLQAVLLCHMTTPLSTAPMRSNHKDRQKLTVRL